MKFIEIHSNLRDQKILLNVACIESITTEVTDDKCTRVSLIEGGAFIIDEEYEAFIERLDQLDCRGLTISYLEV